MRTLPRILLMVLVIVIAGCAAKGLPPGYESLRTETNLVEVSKYIQGMRDSYLGARQRGILTPAQFAQAVKADQTLTAVWNTYLEASKVKNDTVMLWSAVIQSVTTLENMLIVWIPEFSAGQKPVMLGKPATK